VEPPLVRENMINLFLSTNTTLYFAHALSMVKELGYKRS